MDRIVKNGLAVLLLALVVRDVGFGQGGNQYQHLQFKSFDHNTRIDFEYLEIRSNDTISVRNGDTLMIIVTRGLRIGRNVVFSAVGDSGGPGVNATDRITYTTIGDAGKSPHQIFVEMQGIKPSKTAHPDLVGKKGQAGKPGGHFIFVVNNVGLSGNNPIMNVNGGKGGPAGISGYIFLQDGDNMGQPGYQSNTNRVDDDGPGDSGMAGSVSITVGGANAANVRTRLTQSAMPANSVVREYLAQPASVFAHEVSHARSLAAAHNFDTVSH